MSLSLYVHALRAARPRQLRRRVTRPLRRRLLPSAARSTSPRPLVANDQLWRSPAFDRLASEPRGLLAEFAVNYGDDVTDAARMGATTDARMLINAWIDGYPPRVGPAWHPYVVSTRIGNWVAALSLLPELATPRVGESLRRQLVYLRRNVEDDILGNHVIRNAKALILGGVAVGDTTAVECGRRILARELPEQVLEDGGHYERSPAYHRLVLRDLLELRAFAEVEDAAANMESFATASSRPDGAPALFNDGGLDIAPVLELPAPVSGVDQRVSSGYVFLRRPDLWLAFDCGSPAPSFLPAHAHADGLSFQLWIEGRPAIVDPGTSTYEPGRVRAWERGTESHSTVAAGGDQFRVWGAFRAGPLPSVRLLEATPERLVGEAILPGGVRFRRTLRIGTQTLDVEDVLEGSGALSVASSLPFPPDPSSIRVTPREGELVVEHRTFAERFGEPEKATAAVQRRNVHLPWEGGWTISWNEARRSYSGDVAAA